MGDRSRRARYISLVTASLAVALGVSVRGLDSGRTYGAATGVMLAAPTPSPAVSQPVPAQVDRVALGPEESAEAISDTDSPELRTLQRKFEAVVQSCAPSVVSISAAETASNVDATVRS